MRAVRDSPAPRHKVETGHRDGERKDKEIVGRAQFWGQVELARTLRKDSRYIFSDYVDMVSNDLALAIGMTVCFEPT